MEKRSVSVIDPDNLPAPINHDSLARRINAKVHPSVGLTVAGISTISAAVEAIVGESKLSMAIAMIGIWALAIGGYVSSVASRETRRVKKLQKGMLPPQQLVKSAS